MPISPAGRNDRRGLTLVELLVVITIAAMMATGAMLVGGGMSMQGDPLDRIATRLDGALTRAREGAVLGRVATGFHLRADGWQAMRLVPGQGWQADGAPVSVPGVTFGWSLALAPPAPGAATLPALRLAPDGAVIPVSLRLSAGGRSLNCSAGGTGDWRCG